MVIRLLLWSAESLFPSKETLAFLRTKKIVSSTREELKMYGKIAISRLSFKSEITANDAMVIPIAKEPELPTKILPLKLK